MVARNFKPSPLFGAAFIAVALVVSVAVAQPMPADHAAHAGHSATTGAASPMPMPPSTAPAASGDPALAQQVAELRQKVAQLDAAVRPNAGPTTAPSAMAGMAPAAQPAGGIAQPAAMPMPGGPPAMAGGGTPPMGDMMQEMGAMMQQMGGMMNMKKGGMAPGGMEGMGGMSGGGMPSGAPASGMAPMGPAQSMQGMGSGMMGMPPAPAMAASALPGFPGASHLYHVGADDFFLNHDQHISLTTQQRTSLSQAREAALLEKATAERKIAAAEQELWQLTSADQPDGAKVEAKIHEVEKLRGDERMSFIRSVGEAAKVLTADQTKQLLGQLPAAMAPAMAAPAAPAMGGMGHM